jgi:hypothetical protein
MSASDVIPAQAGIAPALRFPRTNGDSTIKRDSRLRGNDGYMDPRQ